MDSIADMGGTQGWGPAQVPTDEPPFAEPWEGRSFAITVLTMGRISGRNLDAFRHALGRLHPVDYLVDGYYGRWLNAAELMLTDSQILAPGAVDARARRNLRRGRDGAAVPGAGRAPTTSPPPAGSLREVEHAAGVRRRRRGADEGHAARRARPSCRPTCADARAP